ncbi:MAG: ABC transporter ATP-binding protein [Lachnospiraceae bacterium]|nr:ABC transporter ATP-binding protein [Lachnospiraceae bacterium]
MKSSTVRRSSGTWHNLKRGGDFVRYCVKRSPVVCLADMCMYLLTIGLFPVLTASIWGRSLDLALEGSGSLGLSLLLLILLGGISSGCLFWGEILDNLFRCRVSILMQERIHKKASLLSVEAYEDSRIRDMADKANKVFYFGPAIGFFFSGTLILAGAVCSVLSILVLGGYHYTYSLIMLALLAADLWKISIHKQRAGILNEHVEERRAAEILRSYTWKFEAVKETKMHLAEAFFSDRWKTVMQHVLAKEKDEFSRTYFQEAVLKLASAGLLAAGYGMSIYLLVKGSLSVGAFGTVVILLRQSEKYAETLSQAMGSMGGDLEHIKAGYEFLELPEVEVTEKEYNSDKARIEEVSLQGVSYMYPGSEDKMALNDIQFSMHREKLYAVVGENGAGKTTLGKLILGLYRPTKGKVTVNGRPAESINETERMAGVSAVFQDFNIYPLTAAENITLSSDSIETGLIPSFVETNDLLGKEIGGKELSGGEKQQLAIARGKYKNAGVLVLDEPTSAMDSFTEDMVFRSFAEISKEKIGVIITHRMGIVTQADEIIVLKEGRIEAIGSHNMLLQECPYYRTLWESGRSMYEINEDESKERRFSYAGGNR